MSVAPSSSISLPRITPHEPFVQGQHRQKFIALRMMRFLSTLERGSHEPMSTTYKRGEVGCEKTEPSAYPGCSGGRRTISEQRLFGGYEGMELWGGRARRQGERLTATWRNPHARGNPASDAPAPDVAAYRVRAATRANFRRRVRAADESAVDRAAGSPARRLRAGQARHTSRRSPSSSLRVRGSGALAALIRPRSVRNARRRRVRTVAGGIPSTAPTSVASMPE